MMNRLCTRPILRKYIHSYQRYFSKVIEPAVQNLPKSDKPEENYSTIINSNEGLKKYMNKIHIWTFCTGTSSLIASMLLTPLIRDTLPDSTFMITGITMSCVSIIGVGLLKPNNYKKNIDITSSELLFSTNSIPRSLCYALLPIGTVITCAPLMCINSIPAFIGVIIANYGANYYVLTKKPSEIKHWDMGNPISYGFLIGDTTASQAFMASGIYIIPANPLYMCIKPILITGIISNSIYSAIESYQSQNSDHFLYSNRLFLFNTVNFVMLIGIINNIKHFL